MAQTPFSSAAYWEQRYRGGGDSGAGSHGRLAIFKAEVLNALVRDNAVRSTVELGCGDGSQLALLDIPNYTGLDVAPTAIAQCRALFPGHRFALMSELAGMAPAELAMSLDVVYHLVEDAVFAGYMAALFASATRFVVVYASDVEQTWPSQHVRHRRFTAHVAERFPDWRLAAVVPNAYPYDPARPDDTSFAAFHIYRRPGEGLRIAVPGIVISP